jgi:hypothetical protein
MGDLLFVTAQPDVPYFHWQCEIYGYNFVEKGIKPSQIHMIFGLVNGINTPSEGALKLREKGYNVHFYIDERDNKHYIPSIKPYMIHKWLEEFPQNGKHFFLHDADIIFREIPNLNQYLNDDVSYMSDTTGYIAYNYIIDCCRRYESAHPTSNVNQLLQEMVDIVGIDIDCVKSNQENSGGGQYIIKNTTSENWYKIYDDSNKLYNQMMDYQKRFPISPGEIQFWTAEMWSVLWNLWYFKKETKIINDLDFSWATDSLDIYNKKPILHMAGVTDNLKGSKFYKGDYISENPLEKIKNDENYFNYIEENSSTIKYIEVMKSIVKKSNN